MPDEIIGRDDVRSPDLLRLVAAQRAHKDTGLAHPAIDEVGSAEPESIPRSGPPSLAGSDRIADKPEREPSQHVSSLLNSDPPTPDRARSQSVVPSNASDTPSRSGRREVREEDLTSAADLQASLKVKEQEEPLAKRARTDDVALAE